MSPKIFWKSLLVAPALLGAALVTSTAAFAADAPAATDLDAVAAEDVSVSDLQPIADLNTASVDQIVADESSVQVSEVPATDDSVSVASLEQVMEYSNEGSSNGLAQVTSVTQLSDVQPTDWAYQALQSLVERYGCIAGYPDGTFRGNRPMTRYEFAAGLNACLDRINELIAQGLGVSPDDLAAISRLQEDFAAQLATLRGRVDSLEARLAEVESNQFSTTTKLNGHVIFNTAAVIGEDENFFDNQVTFGYRVRMNFDSSFTGDDRLRIRLQGRDIQDFTSDPIGYSYGGTSLAGNGDTDNIELDNLFYDFPVGNRIQVRIGANGLDVDELVSSTISPLDSSTSGSISDFGFPAQYSIVAEGDAGAGLIYQLTDNFSIDLGYTASDASSPQAGEGLFNGAYSAIAQLTYLSSKLDAAAMYMNTYDGLDEYDTLGFQFNFRLSDGIEIGGGGAYVDRNNSDEEAWSYQATLAFPDLGGEGNMLGILAGVPPYVAGPGAFDTGFLVETFYRYQVNDRISITPSIVWIADPYNNNNIDDTIYGAIRTTFEF
jgi:hypothetical protein